MLFNLWSHCNSYRSVQYTKSQCVCLCASSLNLKQISVTNVFTPLNISRHIIYSFKKKKHMELQLTSAHTDTACTYCASNVWIQMQVL